MPINLPSAIIGVITAVLMRFLWDVWTEYRREKQRKQIVSDIDGAIVLIAHIPHTPTLTDDDATDAIAALEEEWNKKQEELKEEQ